MNNDLSILKTPDITLMTVASWGPCYAPERLKKLAAGRATITALEILDLPIFVDDRLWAVLRDDFFTREQLVLIACDFAERVCPIYEKRFPGDARPRDCINAARGVVAGTIIDSEPAARAAEEAAGTAWAARAAEAAEAAGAAAGAAREPGARSAARAALWAVGAVGAAWAAEAAEQIEIVRRYLQNPQLFNDVIANGE